MIDVTGYRIRVQVRAGLVTGFVLIGLSVSAPAATSDSNRGEALRTAPIERDSIDAAKLEFERMKAARDPAQQQKAGLPKLSAPEMQAQSTDVRPWASPGAKAGEAKKKSANWLVDAMEKPREERDRSNTLRKENRTSDRRDEAPDASEARPDGTKATGELAEKLSRGNTAERGHREAEVERRNEVANPLNQYLGTWMTAKDYAILKPGLDTPLTSKPADALGTTAMPILGASGGFTPASDGYARRGTGFESVPRENPYLQAPGPMVKPEVLAPVTMAKPAVTVAGPAAMPSAITSIPAGNAAAKPRVPDFAKPAQDEKYFKPLKRF